MISLFVALVALADPGADVAALAPTPADLHARLDASERALTVADALDEAVSRIQNDWVERGFGDSTPACTDAEPMSLAARSVLFGEAWRDAAELAGTRSQGLARLPDERTLAPLMTSTDRTRIAEVEARVVSGRRRYLEAAAWHARHLARIVKRCAPVLAPVPGIERREARAHGEVPVATAVATAAPGLLCSVHGEVRASGVVVVLGDEACYSADSCGCTPGKVAPGAVLGPSTATSDG